jgi:hypothetical protein
MCAALWDGICGEYRTLQNVNLNCMVFLMKPLQSLDIKQRELEQVGEHSFQELNLADPILFFQSLGLMVVYVNHHVTKEHV